MSQSQSCQSPPSDSGATSQDGPSFPLTLLAYHSFAGATAEDDPVAQLQQAVQDYEQELLRLTSVNQSLQTQLVHAGINVSVDEQQRQFEAAILQTEKMAALGLLVAGIAHEINGPLGAIQASVENLDYSIGQTLGFIPQLCRSLSEAQLAAFEQLLTWAGQSQGHRSSREERALKRKIKEQLQAWGFERAPQIAATLSTMGITQDLTALLPILQASEAELILNGAYNLSAIQSTSHNIGIATDRTQNIVGSLRNYARKSSRAEPTLSHLYEGLETVLTLYQNKLKHGVELSKEFDDVPPLLCYPEALEQAWGNLIGNAIQAMEGEGKLEISLTRVEESLVVRIVDSGPGIPEAALAQIFMPYFTTKPMGQGSGLGLAITQKIIDRHGGLITVESHPGKTCFQVNLPLGALSQSHGSLCE